MLRCGTWDSDLTVDGSLEVLSTGVGESGLSFGSEREHVYFSDSRWVMNMMRALLGSAAS